VPAPLQLQEDKDFHHWGVDFHSIYWRARHHGRMDVVRRPMVDFDPHTLRRVLPSAVRIVAEALQGGKRWVRVPFPLQMGSAVGCRANKIAEQGPFQIQPLATLQHLGSHRHTAAARDPSPCQSCCLDPAQDPA
jgi:hypothetical protein